MSSTAIKLACYHLYLLVAHSINHLLVTSIPPLALCQILAWSTYQLVIESDMASDNLNAVWCSLVGVGEDVRCAVIRERVTLHFSTLTVSLPYMAYHVSFLNSSRFFSGYQDLTCLWDDFFMNLIRTKRTLLR